MPAGHVVKYATHDGGWKTMTTTLASATTLAAIQVNGWVFAEPTAGYPGAVVTAAPGLSPGAQAALGVGIALAVVGLATLVAGICMFRRARRAAAGPAAYAGVGQHDDAHAAMFAAPPPQHASSAAAPGRRAHGGSGGLFGFAFGRRGRPARDGRPSMPPQELSSGGSSSAGPASPMTFYAASSQAPPSHPGAIAPSPWRGSTAAGSGYAISSQTGASHGGRSGGLAGGGGAGSDGRGWEGQAEPVGSAPAVQPVDVMEMAAVASPVLHPGDLQPQGYGPGVWKPGPVYG